MLTKNNSFHLSVKGPHTFKSSNYDWKAWKYISSKVRSFGEKISPGQVSVVICSSESAVCDNNEFSGNCSDDMARIIKVES